MKSESGQCRISRPRTTCYCSVKANKSIVFLFVYLERESLVCTWKIQMLIFCFIGVAVSFPGRVAKDEGVSSDLLLFTN